MIHGGITSEEIATKTAAPPTYSAHIPISAVFVLSRLSLHCNDSLTLDTDTRTPTLASPTSSKAFFTCRFAEVEHVFRQ
jgi:hypothetical protein